MGAPRPHLLALAPLAVAVPLATIALVRPGGPASQAAPQPAALECECELRSWVVAGRGRHLLLEIDCPEPLGELDGVVEFTSAALRSDYDASLDRSGAPRIARMTRGERLEPMLTRAGQPAERSEARWTIDPATAACLQRDRLFAAQYLLLGPNSNSAMASMLTACGLALPDAVAAGAGILGEFPGIDLDPGEAIPADRWRHFGVQFTEQ